MGRRYKRPVLLLFLSTQLSALSTLLVGCGRKADVAPILIGQVMPAVGADLTAAEHARRGVILAVDEANRDEGMIQGRRVEVLHADAANDREAVRAAAVRLISINKVAGLLGGTDPVQVDGLVEGLGGVAENAKVPLVAAGGSREQTPHGFVFHVGVSPADQGRALARFAATKFPDKPVAVLVNKSDPRGQAHSLLAEAFGRELRKNGGRTAGEWTFRGAADLKELVERMATPAPAAVLVAGVVEDLESLRGAGLGAQTALLLGAPEGALPALQARPVPNPVYLATAFAPGEEAAPTQDFVHRFRERFQEAPDVHAALAYDAARFLFEGLRRAPTTEPGRVREALDGIQTFDTVTGKFSLRKDGWLARTEYVVEVVNGQAKKVQGVPVSEAGR